MIRIKCVGAGKHLKHAGQEALKTRTEEHFSVENLEVSPPREVRPKVIANGTCSQDLLFFTLPIHCLCLKLCNVFCQRPVNF